MTDIATDDRIRIVHVITGTDVGGAETMLTKLISAHDRERFEVRVASVQPSGPIAERISAMGVEVTSLGARNASAAIPAVGALSRSLRHWRPHVVQTWLYHADLIGGIASLLARVPALAWNIRNGTLDAVGSKRSTIMVVRALARLSRRLPKRIVCCSENARSLHVSLGYDAGKMTVIPNGFDLNLFRPDARARDSVRSELGVAADTPLAGLVARYHAQKDHGNFVAAARRVLDRVPRTHFLLCGERVTADNAELAGFIAKSGAPDRFHLLGRRADIPRISAALDVAISASSFGEAFPNVLGEAMACGV
ncbi:MAG TPA: glycosyltransferase, partial [Chthonomonadaceae bacterium]|nr:glycosyltransferase [Chthonomonadaceae bacterium]